MAVGSALSLIRRFSTRTNSRWRCTKTSCLRAFWSGVPVASPDEPLPIWMPNGSAARSSASTSLRRCACIPAIPVVPARRKAALPAGEWTGRPSAPHLPLVRCLDRAAYPRLKPKLVVAYENSAYHTFAAAKAVGARCVLDAASLHHRTSFDLMDGRRQSAFDIEVNRRKDAETEMADLILTCSPLAADSYLSHGVPASKVHPLLLGAELPARMTRLAPSATARLASSLRAC